MIQDFEDAGTEDIFQDRDSKQARKTLPLELHRAARRKLAVLDAAKFVEELRIPPGNQLEKLKGDLEEFWSIRINAQWRIVFIWNDGMVRRVRICDYH